MPGSIQNNPPLLGEEASAAKKTNFISVWLWRYQSFLLVLLSGIPLLCSFLWPFKPGRVVWSVGSILVIPCLRLVMRAVHGCTGGLSAHQDLAKQLDLYSLKNGRGCCNSRFGDLLIPFYPTPFQLRVLARSFSTVFILCHVLTATCMLMRNIIWETPADGSLCYKDEDGHCYEPRIGEYANCTASPSDFECIDNTWVTIEPGYIVFWAMYLVLSQSGGTLGYLMPKLDSLRHAYQHHGKRIPLVNAMEGNFRDHLGLILDSDRGAEGGQLKAGYIVFLAVFFAGNTLIRIYNDLEKPNSRTSELLAHESWGIRVISVAFYCIEVVLVTLATIALLQPVYNVYFLYSACCNRAQALAEFLQIPEEYSGQTINAHGYITRTPQPGHPQGHSQGKLPEVESNWNSWWEARRFYVHSFRVVYAVASVSLANTFTLCMAALGYVIYIILFRSTTSAVWAIVGTIAPCLLAEVLAFYKGSCIFKAMQNHAMLIKKRSVLAAFAAENAEKNSGQLEEGNEESASHFSRQADKMVSVIVTDQDEVPFVVILGLPLTIKPTLFRVVAISLSTAAGTFIVKEVMNNL